MQKLDLSHSQPLNERIKVVIWCQPTSDKRTTLSSRAVAVGDSRKPCKIRTRCSYLGNISMQTVGGHTGHARQSEIG